MSSVNLPRSNISLKITIKGGFYSETAFLYDLHSFLHFPQKTFGGYEEKSYLCRRKAALGKLKASFLCARLHFLCRRKAALGKLKIKQYGRNYK